MYSHEKSTVLSGVQPTNKIHIGNYFGAIKNMVINQNQYNNFIFIADLHALTLLQNQIDNKLPLSVHENSLYLLATYLACGIDLSKTTLFRQSDVVAHAYFSWILSCITPMGRLDRMVQMKDKSKSFGRMLGIYSYPVLMASDILLYNPKYVPVGEDQEQHLELVRYLATSVNNILNEKYFNEPEILNIKELARVKSLSDGTKKMSKSDSDAMSCIFLDDNIETMEKKIKKAKTDTFSMPTELTSDLQNERPEIFNLLSIYSACSEEDLKTVIQKFNRQMISVFKKELLNIIIEKIYPIGQEMKRIYESKNELYNILLRNKNIAAEEAEKNLMKVKKILL